MNFYDILLARALCCKMGSEEEPLEVTENGQYIAPEGKAFNPVTVNVPLPSGTLPITENGIYDVYSYASVDVDMAGGISVDDIAMRTISEAITGSSASWIGSYAFAYCSSLAEVSFPVCTSIGEGAFMYCRSLAEVSFPVCTRIGTSAFAYCSSLAEVSFPVCTSIGQGTFAYCSSLAEVSFPVCTSIGGSAFYSCSSLAEASFPSCARIGGSAFMYCRSLAEVSFPSCTSIGAMAFRNCYNLLSFNLTGVSSVPTLSGASVFYSTPIGGYTASTGGAYGSIYVPSSLLTAFQTAPNWSLISSRIVGV